MRSTKSKNQNQQIPSEQGRAVTKEQSPICLVKDHKGPCSHRNCLMAYTKPGRYGISIAEFHNKKEFTEFEIHKGHRRPHLVPKNPNPGNNNFEGFRQSLNAIIRLAGRWPASISVVPREHVEYRWAEYIATVPSFNYETLENEWIKLRDVYEFAYYIGPLENFECLDVDGNEVIESRQDRENLKEGGSSC